MKRPLDKRFVDIIKYVRAISDVKYEMRFGGNAYVFTEPPPGKYNSEWKDSSAAHSWSASYLGRMIAKEANRQGLYDPPLNVSNISDMMDGHDVPEGKAKDTAYDRIYQLDLFALKAVREEQFVREEAAMKDYVSLLPPDLAREEFARWYEFETLETQDAKFCKIMDRIDSAHTVMKIGVGEGAVAPDSVASHASLGYGWHPLTDAIIEYTIGELKRYFKEHGLKWKRSYNLPKPGQER